MAYDKRHDNWRPKYCICPPEWLLRFVCNEAPDPLVGTWCVACHATSLETFADVETYITLHPDAAERMFLSDLLPQVRRIEAARRELNAGLERPRPSMEMPVIPFELDGDAHEKPTPLPQGEAQVPCR